jgi:simple sugar transport system substrate-binding protein
MAGWRKRTWLGCAGLSLVLVLGACSAAGSNSPPAKADASSGASTSAGSSGCLDPNARPLKIALIGHFNWTESGLDGAYIGRDLAAKQFCMTITTTGKSNDVVGQAQLIDAAVAQKVDGIATSLPDPTGLKESIEHARAAGIPVTTWNSGASGFAAAGSMAHAGQDEVVAGEKAGEYMAQQGLKHVGCISHVPDNIGLQERCQGLKKGIEAGGGTVTTIPCINCDSDPATTLSTIKAALAADPSLDGLLTLNPDIGNEAVQAVADAGAKDKVKLATFDLNKDGIKYLESGDLMFGISQGFWAQDYTALWSLYMIINYGVQPGAGVNAIYTGPTFVTKDNVELYKKLVAQNTY